MKKYLFIVGTFLLISSCKKDKVPSPKVVPVNCQLEDTISYANQIQPILNNNCLPCHQYPGSGGINLDTYLNVKSIALSGQLVQSIIHDTNYIIMPPLPQNQLDSCQIKTVKRWVLQGCLEN